MSDSDIKDAILLADAERIRAVLKRDRNGLEKMLCDDIVYTHSSGSEESKDDYIDKVVSGSYDYKAFDQLRMNFRVVEPFVFVNGENNVDIVRGGALNLLSGRYQMTWKREDGRWKLFSFCAAPIPRQ